MGSTSLNLTWTPKWSRRLRVLREEQCFYTFQTVCTAVEERFPKNVDKIMNGMVEMLTFDALVGNNDRHPANWGVITPRTTGRTAQVFAGF